MKSDAYQLIKATQRMPSPKGVALEILRLTDSDDTTVEALGVVIESDPALSSQLLKIVNSPLSGMSRKVGSISRATVLLGFNTVASLALSLSVVTDNRESTCEGFDYDQFWSESLAQAVAGRHLAKLTKLFSPDETFTCGLLSQIGRLAFASAYPDRYSQALRVVGEDRNELNEFETELFGISHDALAAEMMNDWRLPELFSESVRGQQNPDAAGFEPDSRPYKFAKLLHLSGAIAEVLVSLTVEPDKLSSITNEAFHLGIRPDQLQEAFDLIREEWRDAGRIFRIPTREVPTLGEIHSRCTKRRSDLAEAG